MASKHQALAAAAVVGSAAVSSSAFVAGPAVQQGREVSASHAQNLRASAAAGAGAGAGSSTLPLSVLGAALGATAAVASVRRSGRSAKDGIKVRAFENELGVQPPVGFWDPAGFTAEGNQYEFYRRRCIELKHGRVSMLACTGYIVQEFVRFPGFLSPSSNIKFADIPNGLAAVEKVPAVGWFQYTVFCGICDLWLCHQVQSNPPGKLTTRLFGESITNYEYGSIGLPGYLGGKPVADPELKKKKLNAELANGRLAMMAIMGMFFQDGLTGSAWGDWANYVDSPLRAFENELGVQAPVGFWDPLGFTAGGDAASFRRRRYVELKHGRVSMLACLGYIVPEYYRLPGDLSPSLGLKFSDVPTGFAAFSKVPGSGWAQMVAFAGSVELFQYVDDPTRPPGDFANAGSLGIPNGYLRITDPEAKKKKLSAEIANGRLAMMAIIGMFFQDGLTGSAWGDWSLYTDSPLRASAQDVLAGTGGPFPENYWDPAGISKNKTEEEILELRATELKHGRVAMLACLGWFHVAAGWHFIGDYAIGERTSDNPLIAITQMPMGSVWQVVFTIMCVEWLTSYVCVPPKDKPWDVLGWSEIIADEEAPSWKEAQVRELNNGRLAMLGFVGLVAGDLMTGEYAAGIGKPCFGYCMDFADAANYWGGIDQTKFSGPYEHPPLITGFW